MVRDAASIANHLELVVLYVKTLLSFYRIDRWCRFELFLACVGCACPAGWRSTCGDEDQHAKKSELCWSMLSTLLVPLWISTSRCRCAPKKISLVNEVLLGLEWRDLIGQHCCFLSSRLCRVFLAWFLSLFVIVSVQKHVNCCGQNTKVAIRFVQVGVKEAQSQLLSGRHMGENDSF